MKVIATPDQSLTKRAVVSGNVGVCLFGGPPVDSPRIGFGLLAAFEKWGIAPDQVAIDFLSIALGVTASDVFLKRSAYAVDGWIRNIELEVAVQSANVWAPHKLLLESILSFLTGDYWNLQFRNGGFQPPLILSQRPKTSKVVSLFSGGLDSCIGLLDLVTAGRAVAAVSHLYPGDAAAQSLAQRVGNSHVSHFQAGSDPRGTDLSHETSMRGRSLLFLAMATAVATTLNPTPHRDVELILPENGFISLNVPLTSARIGSLSTRTTHPYFVHQLQTLLDRLGLRVQIVNPYSLMTKGEMVARCADQVNLMAIYPLTVSCGKKGRKLRWDDGRQSRWNPDSTHCGKCVPCIIRRAALYAAGISDQTIYEWRDLAVVKDEADLLAFRIAIVERQSGKIGKMLVSSGPIPAGAAPVDAYADVVLRGTNEVQRFLASSGAL